MIIAELVVFLYLLFKVKSLFRESWLDKKFIFVSVGSCAVMAVCVLGIQQVLFLHVGLLILLGAIVYIGTSWPFCAKFMRRTFAE